MLQKAHHFKVLLRYAVAHIGELNNKLDVSAGIKIVFNYFAPFISVLPGHLGKAVTGQVNEVALSVHGEVVHMDGLAWLFTHTGEILALQQTVDDGRLTHIGFSGKGNLGHPGFGKILGRCSGDQKFNFL